MWAGKESHREVCLSQESRHAIGTVCARTSGLARKTDPLREQNWPTDRVVKAKETVLCHHNIMKHTREIRLASYKKLIITYCRQLAAAICQHCWQSFVWKNQHIAYYFHSICLSWTVDHRVMFSLISCEALYVWAPDSIRLYVYCHKSRRLGGKYLSNALRLLSSWKLPAFGRNGAIQLGRNSACFLQSLKEVCRSLGFPIQLSCLQKLQWSLNLQQQ